MCGNGHGIEIEGLFILYNQDQKGVVFVFEAVDPNTASIDRACRRRSTAQTDADDGSKVMAAIMPCVEGAREYQVEIEQCFVSQDQLLQPTV